MRIELKSGVLRTTTVCRLSFPFEVTYETSGPMWYVKEGVEHHVEHARKAQVPPLTTIDIGLCGDTTASIRRAGLSGRRNARQAELCESDTMPQMTRARPSSRALTLAAALHIYRAPQLPWSMDLLASVLGLSKAELSLKLFAEGGSFRQIVRTQRLMRIFSDLGRIRRIDDEVVKKFGFSHQRQLECAFSEHFGIGVRDMQAVLGNLDSMGPIARQLLQRQWGVR